MAIAFVIPPVPFLPVQLSDLQHSPSHIQTAYTSSLIREVDSPETIATTFVVDTTPWQLNDFCQHRKRHAENYNMMNLSCANILGNLRPMAHPKNMIRQYHVHF